MVRNIDKSKFASGEPADGKVFYMRRLLGNGIGTMALGRRNTMVCTEYMGEYGLQALEDAVLRYVERSKRRVIYRVTPIFEAGFTSRISISHVGMCASFRDVSRI